MAAVTDTTIIENTILFFRGLLVHPNVTDPFNATRTGNQKFVMTQHPDRDVKYPVITVEVTNMVDEPLAMSSEAAKTTISIEIQVWGRNAKERDQLSQQVYHKLRTSQNDAGTGQIANNIHDFTLISSNLIGVDGSRGLKRRLFNIQVNYYSNS